MAIVGLSAVNMPVHATCPFQRTQRAAFVLPFRRFAAEVKTALQVNYAGFGCRLNPLVGISLSVLSSISAQTAIAFVSSSIGDEFITSYKLRNIVFPAATSHLATLPRNGIFPCRQLVEERARRWWLAICRLGATKLTPRRHSGRRSGSLRYSKRCIFANFHARLRFDSIMNMHSKPTNSIHQLQPRRRRHFFRSCAETTYKSGKITQVSARTYVKHVSTSRKASVPLQELHRYHLYVRRYIASVCIILSFATPR